jgi:triacylglycerol lipase
MKHLRWALAAMALIALLAAGTASAAKPGGGGGGGTVAHNPILFVHGWSESGTIWNTDISRFQADGWTSAQLNNWSYNTSQSNATTAAQIQTKVDQILSATGATKVDLITHSMGALSTRYYIKNLGGTTKVHNWVSLGGPNHGTDIANLCTSQACTEMRKGSSFLTNLNATDETPGAVSYRTFYSDCDTVVPDGVPISGATNTKTACIGHNDLYSDATVYAQMRDFVAPLG